MNYAALNAKICAMGARLTDMQGREPIADAANICRYISGKPQRDFVMAMALAAHGADIHYYATQWKRLNRLDKPNRIAIKGILGAEIDLVNILWMYRLKRYHRVTGNATFGHLIPIRYLLSRETTRHMADCISPAALIDEVENSPYAMDFVNISERFMQAGAPTPEQMLAIAIGKRYQSAARRYPNTLAPALAYLQRISR